MYDPRSRIIPRLHHRDTFATLSDFNSSEIRRRIHKYTKFMFTRHPLKRLISAYRSKFKNTYPYTENYRREYGKEVVARYRANKSSVPPNAPINDVTFEEFTGLVLNPPKLPLDVHWRPTTDLCHPCAVRYDFVGRHENLEARARPDTQSLPTYSFPTPRSVSADDVLCCRRMRAACCATSAPASLSPGFLLARPSLLIPCMFVPGCGRGWPSGYRFQVGGRGATSAG